jgi:hypothetical protein
MHNPVAITLKAGSKRAAILCKPAPAALRGITTKFFTHRFAFLAVSKANAYTLIVRPDHLDGE